MLLGLATTFALVLETYAMGFGYEKSAEAQKQIGIASIGLAGRSWAVAVIADSAFSPFDSSTPGSSLIRSASAAQSWGWTSRLRLPWRTRTHSVCFASECK